MRRNQAEELNRLKINFYTEVSHELRTPLSLIKGPIFDILERSSLDANNRKKLEIAGRNVERMTNLVDEIMVFTESGKEAVRLKATEGDILKFVEEITLFFITEATGRNIDFRFHSSDEEIILYFDRDKLEKVFFNILSNAFKFTSNGGKIEIRAEHHSKNKSIRFSVFNTGKPVPEHDINHLFERFYTNKTAKVEGHGIGLSLAAKIIEQHHGKIWVENITNGVCFYVELPVGKDHLDPMEVVANSSNSENPMHYVQMDDGAGKALVKVKNKTALIVEDNAELRNYIVLYLSEHFTVLTAANGKIGLDRAIEHSPDIVISDLMMPEMDGLTMCRMLKTDIRTSHIPIIILTARNSLRQQIDGYEMGADAYVTKPFNAQLLLARISNLIASREKLREIIKTNVDFSPKEITVTTLDEKILTQTINVIEKYIDVSDFGVDKLCEEIGMSRSQLYRKIKALTSFSINEFIRLIRLKRAAQLLKQDDSSVSQVMHQVGFENQSFFSKAFKEQFGVSPKQYKAKTTAPVTSKNQGDDEMNNFASKNFTSSK
jgi:DNA-binding response OmpR family regulator